MLIYQIPNQAQSVYGYVCDSQETIDSAPKRIQPQCSIGTQTDAGNQLTTNQTEWLTQQANLFTVNLQTVVSGGVVWTIVNLDNELENTDRMYFVLNPVNGVYTEATGLAAAKELFVQTQQDYLVFTNMDKYITLTSWN